MPFERPWDTSCPRLWDQWEIAGTRYVIQDLPPEDDDLAVQLLVENYLTDEPLCSMAGAANDSKSVQTWKEIWSERLKQRMSLACYVDRDVGKALVAVNCCVVGCKNEQKDKSELKMKFEGEALWNVFDIGFYIMKKVDSYKYMETDKLLGGVSLIVKKEYRRANIGTRILNAREPFCRAYGVKGSTTIFSSDGSQKCAERVGFTTLVEASWKELAEAGFKCPSDENKVIKLMVKKYS